MNTISKLVVAAVACASLSSCAATHSYVDPQYHMAGYDQIHRLNQPIPVMVNAQFQRNGQPYPAVDAQLQEVVERTLRATGNFTPTSSLGDAGIIQVVADNIADLAAARAKGFGTGITFGAAGSNVTDYYEFKFTYRSADGKEHQRSYKDAIYTTIGHASPPVSAPPTTLNGAFEKVVEDVTLNFVKDLQADDALSTVSN
jgi:hypothetical protein